MSTKIAILGVGHTGVQTAVYLLDQISNQIIIYDDDISYAQGMVLDCMQAASVEGYRGTVVAAKNLAQLNKASVLIICEDRNEKIPLQWEKTAKNFIQKFSGLCIYAGQNIKEFKTFAKTIPQKSKKLFFSVHAIVDAQILAQEAAKQLDISIKDVHAAVGGGIGANMQSKGTWLRAGGIPVEEIKKGTFKKSLEAAKKTRKLLKNDPWNFYYTFAAAAAMASLSAISPKGALLCITTENGNTPAIITQKGYVKYNEVKK